MSVIYAMGKEMYRKMRRGEDYRKPMSHDEVVSYVNAHFGIRGQVVDVLVEK